MAVTSVWPIRGRVDKVVWYARNPAKTTELEIPELQQMHTIDGVVEYAADEDKTEERSYVSCINLISEEDAAKQFVETQKRYQKTTGRICYHGYQSFRPGEVDAEAAHKIGVALASEMWGDRFEVVVATHCNTGCYHNHFVINSVSFMDGYKFYNSHADYRRMREISDRLCREAKISVIENPGGRRQNYSEWLAEKNGKPTRRGTIREDIDRAISSSTTEQGFIQTMTEMGYEFKTRGENGQRLKYPALKPPNAKGFFRFHRLGEGYSLDEVIDRIYDNVRKKQPFPEAEKEAAARLRQEMRFHPRMKRSGLQAIYFRYCYELHIVMKHPASVKRVSFLLREDVSKLDRYIAQTRLLGREQIDTGEQLQSFQISLEDKMQELSGKRTELRNRLKVATRAGNAEKIASLKAQISEISKQMKTARREVMLCKDILERSGQVEANLEQIDHEIEGKETTNDEHIRRSSRSGREDDPERR